MPRNLQCGVFIVLILSVVGLLTSCGNLSSAPINNTNAIAAVSVTITPSSTTVGTGTVTQFLATVNGAGLQTVQWQVNGIPGGVAAIGTIDSNGNYTAPQFVPNPASVVITAIADADNTKSGNADVGITGTLFPATVYLSPTGTAYVQKGTQLKLSAGVTGPADTSVVWQVNGVPNGNASVGTISVESDGTATYTAPANPTSVTINALSHAEQNVYKSCAVTVSEGPPAIPTVTIIPVLAVAGAENNFTFTASLIGDTAVTWDVDGVSGGTNTYGTIASESDVTGVYTGPMTAPPGGIAVVTATSLADSSRNSTAAVLISPPPANGINVGMKPQEASIPVNSSTSITATVGANSITGTVTNPDVTWEVNGIVGGNSTYGTLQVMPGEETQVTYFSPSKVPAQNTVIVEAISQQDSSVVGTVPVTITPVQTIVKVTTPSGQSVVNLGVTQTQIFDATITGQEDQTALWYVCPTSQNCILNGNATYGTVSPTTPTDSITYTAPNSVPSPSTVILKAVSHANPAASGAATITIEQNAVITVIVTPSGPLTDEAGLTYNGDFAALVTGTDDQNVTWNVCTSIQPQVCYAGGNATYGTMTPDPNNPTDDLYQAPVNIPNPNPVFIEAVPEADPSVVSNAVQMTITPFVPQQTVTINLQYSVILPIQTDTVSADVTPGPNQTVNWTLQLPANEGGGDCTSQPLLCGSISPPQTDNTQATYTPPNPIPNGQTTWVVEITATSPIYQNASDTVPVTISQDATTTISISPPSGTIQAGSGQFINFNVNIVNGSQTQNVDWTLSCASEANEGEFCGLPFGDGQWTGCLAGAGGNICEAGALPPPDPANTPVTYTPPPKTGNQYSGEENSCPSQPGQDVVAITADINGNGNNCQGNSCEATACVTITPAGK